MPQYLVTCVVNSLCYGAADVRDGMTGGGAPPPVVRLNYLH